MPKYVLNGNLYNLANFVFEVSSA